MTHDADKAISLTLTVGEVNQILEALAKRPYASVYKLIGRIQKQAERQLLADGETAPALTPEH